MDQLLQDPQGQHVVLFTHNEQSHITPLFNLARLLASRGLQVTCALPATAYASYISNNNNNNNNPSTGPDANLQVESVEESPQHSSDDLLLLQKKLEEGLLCLLGRLQPPPLFLIADVMYFTWSQEVANRLGLSLFLFAPFFATTLLVACHLPQLLQRGLLPFQTGTEEEVIDFIPGLMEGFRIADIPLEFLGRNSAELEAFNFLDYCKACTGLVLCNTSLAFHEVEAEAMDALMALGVRIYPIFPMLHMDWCNNSSLQLYREDDRCLSWLDGQPRGSVVYASFGSIIPLTREEIQELALGLEACGQPFLWVIRRVEGVSDVMSVLPPGFVDRVNNKLGLIVSWAPQMAVLSHPSVGCFLFHSGFASLIEAIWAGVPMIGGFYKISDQNTVFRVMTEGWRVALPLIDKSPPQSLLRNSIETAIKEVLHGERDGGTAASIRQRIAQLRAALKEAAAPNGSSRRYLDHFVDALQLSPS
ncbi:hypothetical protein GOP47_0014846 [Adiantum capillus-veneris]|uniref:Glycosyltransferase n=1 Tax=Adiantum capillus-veneris TaxID=13818 RepID=A0A9D4UNH8_ADICA|nr:hypothetical protein GOP47_0014846 [Adiantum capillus-veneris]